MLRGDTIRYVKCDSHVQTAFYVSIRRNVMIWHMIAEFSVLIDQLGHIGAPISGHKPPNSEDFLI